MLASALTMSAQTWSTVGAGDFYLYNEGTGTYLTSGNGWGTQASVKEDAIRVTLVSSGSGYTIGTSNGMSGTVYLGANGYVDNGTAAVWVFTLADESTNAYTLKNDTYGYLAAQSSSTACTAGSGSDAYSYWHLITADNLKAWAQESGSEDNPFNLTPLIGNANFSRNGNTSAWSSVGGISGDNTNFNHERYHATFETYQTLANMPNGTYKLKVQGYTRDNDDEYAQLYINDTEANFKHIQDDGLSSDTYSTKYTYGGVYCPNNQSQASAYFSAGLYDNEMTATVTDGTVKIGVKDTYSDLWFCFDNFRLYYLGGLSDDTTYELAEDVSSYEGTIPTAAYNNLKDVVDTNNGEYTDVDKYNTAKQAIAEAKATADALVSPYAAAKAMLAAVPTIDDDTSAYTDDSNAASTLQSTIAGIDLESMTTAEELNNATSTLKTAATTFLTAVTINSDIEVTDIYVTNPSFETGDATGWTITAGGDAGVYPNTNGTYTISPIDGDYLANAWQWNSGTVSMYHDAITDLPNGTYNITAALASFENRDLVMSATGTSEVTTAYNTSSNPKGTAVDVSVKNVVVEGSLTFGVSATYTGTEPFVKSDNWRLYITAPTVSEEDAEALLATVPEGKMNADVQTALNEAKEAFEADKTSTEKYAALSTAINNANTSIAAYASLKETTDAMKVEMDNTNIYTEEAYNTFNSQYETWVAAYEAGTISDEEAAAAKEATFGKGANGWHATVTVDNFLLSAWTIGGEQCNEFDKSLYINTWSVEGNNSGKMVVPFFEYWTGDANTLTSTTMTGTVSGLAAGKYKVTLQARVRLTNNNTNTPTGITANVNGGTSVDLCTGTVVDANYSQLYFGEYEVEGEVGSDGTLKLNIVVAEDNNISWLAFKYAKYEYVGTTITFTEKNKGNDDNNEIYVATYVAPFDIDVAALTEAGVTAYALSVDGSSVTYTEISDNIPAGTALVVSAAKTGDYAVTSTTADTKDVTTALKAGDGVITGDDSTIYTLQRGKTSDKLGWYLKAKDSVIAADKCYLVITSSEGVKDNFLGFDTTATGINGIAAESDVLNGKMYSVSGQQVDENYKGIVIVNGKKYLNK